MCLWRCRFARQLTNYLECPLVGAFMTRSRLPIRLCLLIYAAFFCAPLPFVRAQSAVATAPPKMATTPAIVASPESVAEWQYKFSAEDQALLDQIEKGCFQYFWKEVGHPALLARDKTSDVISSTAAVGFQLSSLPIGIERGWITRAEGEERRSPSCGRCSIAKTIRRDGIYFHFVDEDTGGQSDYKNTKYPYELQCSTVDNALFEAGVITASSYFGGEVAKIADKIVQDANCAPTNMTTAATSILAGIAIRIVASTAPAK